MTYGNMTPARMQETPLRSWQNDRIGLLPQQSITKMQKRYPGISTMTLRQKLVCGLPASEVEAKERP